MYTYYALSPSNRLSQVRTPLEDGSHKFLTRLVSLLPVAATAFRFYGMKHRHGGLFGICVGRNPCDPSFQQIDGFNATHNVDNGPVSLFFVSVSLKALNQLV